MTVRSTRLAAFRGAAASFDTFFTCPPGWRVILRSIYYDIAGQQASTITVFLSDYPAGTQMNFITDALPGSGHGVWEGWIVLHPGEAITSYSNTSLYTMWASGTMLLLTGAEAPIP